MSVDAVQLHLQLDELEACGANWQRIMTAHALVDAGVVLAIECAMPRCIYSSRSFDPQVRALALSIDHIVPTSQGGTHYSDNLRLAHLGCNSAAAAFDESATHQRSITAARTRRQELYERRNRELKDSGIERADVWLNRWMTETSDWLWLESTRRLQKTVYHVDYGALRGEELADYIMINATALLVEVSEFLNEVRWKNWTTDRGSVNRSEAVDELVDVGHFLGNLLTALNVTDVEWEVRYRAKQLRNAERQQVPGGYTGKKCPKCHRELDRPTALVMRNGLGVGAKTFTCCAYCDTPIDEVQTYVIESSGKCPRCHRSYDDPGVACHPGDAATNVGTWCGRDHVLIYTNSIGSST